MRLFRRQITSPRLDALLRYLIGYSVADLGAVAMAVNRTVGISFGITGLACFAAAVWSWPRTRIAAPGPHAIGSSTPPP